MRWICILLTLPMVFGPNAAAAELPKQVLVFYYPWYGSQEYSGRWIHWQDVEPRKKAIGSSTHYPVIGAYDSTDPKLIDRQMRQMAEAGVDGVIASWWGRRVERDNLALQKILDSAAKHGRVVSVYQETIHGPDLERSAADDFVFLIERYSKHAAWQKVDDRPVIFVYGRVVGQMGDFKRWNTVRDFVKDKTDVDPYLVGDRISMGAAGVFDAVHTYNPVGALAGKSLEEVRRAYHYMVVHGASITRESGKPVCLTIIPGYDDTKIRDPGLACSRLEGGTYRAGWESAVGSSVRWVLITSWNEWHEGSEIEESVEFGDRELRATGEWTRRFKDPSARPIPLPPSESWGPFAARWRGGTIGLLGSPGTVAPDIATSGLPMRFISMRSFCTGRVTAKDCPAMVYTGGEDIRTRFEDGANLPDAVSRYRAAGGVIVFASSQPWPWHRDLDSGRTAYSREVGLPMLGGFEEPPTAEMRFEFHGPLADLGPQPFPTEGDQRFRPCGGPAAESLKIVPLATLHSADGTDQGPGIALISSRDEAERIAPMVYVWFRMWDVVDREELLRRILGIAAAAGR